ncbi:hypothetical protein GCM10011584_22370 [Nocardioides phosphati]|uniref:FlgD Ig-like domain-containing protein n=1 Tax=Nocardioides phosphati TaxID=1867775 RepID=A0ABQ2NCZ8_9ACTN|nr:hypothetical protein [Nocardioides phosphati]GGO90487.1 hypothetical protein GCM10011584_22370 [Nocardioides phosphati]
MRRHLIHLVSAVGLALGGATLPLTAAHAATGTFATIDTSVDGQVSGTFTSEAGRARVELRGPDGRVSDQRGYTPTAGVPTAFQAYALVLEPGSTATLTLTECDADWGNCVTADERTVTLADAGPVTVAAEPADASPIAVSEHPESSIRVTLGNTENRVGHLRMYVEWLDADGWTLAEFPDTEVELPQPAATYDVGFSPTYMGPGVHRLRLNVRGPRPGQVTTTQEFTVEVVTNPTPPKITAVTLSDTRVYPTRDGYRDSVEIRTSPMWGYHEDLGIEARLEIWNADRTQLLRTLDWSYETAASTVFIWTGRAADGTRMPAGVYATRAVYTDDGRETAYDGPSITVVRKHLEARTWRKVVTAADSRVRQEVGHCSRVRSPSRHGWAGSLGLYSNVKCHDGFDASKVRTIHRALVPAATRHDGVQIDVYGGSPDLSPPDWAQLSYRLRDGRWIGVTSPQSPVGWHTGSSYAGMVHTDRSVQWDMRVNRGKRYDVRSFRITARYRVLVND